MTDITPTPQSVAEMRAAARARMESPIASVGRPTTNGGESANAKRWARIGLNPNPERTAKP